MSFDPEKTFKFSQGSFREMVLTNPEFRDGFLKAILPHLKAIPTYHKDEVMDLHLDALLNSPDIYSVA